MLPRFPSSNVLTIDALLPAPLDLGALQTAKVSLTSQLIQVRPRMYKLGRLQADRWVEHSYPPVYKLPESTEGSQRLVAGVPGGDPEVFLRLASCLEPPYFLLYVLHTPRGEGEPGRYQSPELSLGELNRFVSEFKSFLAQDARFDLWVHSPSERATVVWDRHNQIFAYGPLDRFESELRLLGFSPGVPEVPVPHEHHYRAELDSLAQKVLKALKWSHSPLQPEDEQ